MVIIIYMCMVMEVVTRTIMGAWKEIAAPYLYGYA
jgi:hypothetical protein